MALFDCTLPFFKNVDLHKYNDISKNIETADLDCFWQTKSEQISRKWQSKIEHL
jgi:hypothetical protein